MSSSRLGGEQSPGKQAVPGERRGGARSGFEASEQYEIIFIQPRFVLDRFWQPICHPAFSLISSFVLELQIEKPLSYKSRRVRTFGTAL